MTRAQYGKDLAAAVLDVIRRNPGIRTSELVWMFGRPRRTIAKHLRDLKEAGTVRRVDGLRDARASRWFDAAFLAERHAAHVQLEAGAVSGAS